MSQTQQGRRKPIDALELMLELAQDGDFIAALRRQRARQVSLAECHRDGRQKASRGTPREQTRDRVARRQMRATGRTKRMEAREQLAWMLCTMDIGEDHEDVGPAAAMLEMFDEGQDDPIHQLALEECGCVAGSCDAFALFGISDQVDEFDMLGWDPEGCFNGRQALEATGYAGFHLVDDLRAWTVVDD